jgi:CRP/FNR family transcriptional regulator
MPPRRESASEIAALLQQTPIFARLHKEALTSLAGMARAQHFAHEAPIALQGDVWPYLLRVNSGALTAVKVSPEGRNLVVATIRSGEVFWGLAFFMESAPLPATFLAQGETELLLWKRDDVLPIILANGRFAWELCQTLIQRVQFASEIVDRLAFQPVAGRLARLLLEQSESAGTTPVSRSLTLDDMAARIGTTREVISRLLHRLSDDGMISITRTEFTVEDAQSLSEMAQKVKG